MNEPGVTCVIPTGKKNEYRVTKGGNDEVPVAASTGEVTGDGKGAVEGEVTGDGKGEVTGDGKGAVEGEVTGDGKGAVVPVPVVGEVTGDGKGAVVPVAGEGGGKPANKKRGRKSRGGALSFSELSSSNSVAAATTPTQKTHGGKSRKCKKGGKTRKNKKSTKKSTKKRCAKKSSKK